MPTYSEDLLPVKVFRSMLHISALTLKKREKKVLTSHKSWQHECLFRIFTDQKKKKKAWL